MIPPRPSTQAVRAVLAEPGRTDRLLVEGGGLLLDLARQPWPLADWPQLLAPFGTSAFQQWRHELASGGQVNPTEQRAAWHMELRAGTDEEVGAELGRMLAFAEAVRQGTVTGATGQPFRRIVNLGIGGSDLGPRLVVEALQGLHGLAGPEIRFCANIDPADLQRALAGADPASTLFLLTSKSFATEETLENAKAAAAWVEAALGEGAFLGHHAVAATAHPEAALALGLEGERVFRFWDWVGGRFSLWSAAGLVLALGIGAQATRGLLAGARALDQHFLTAPAAANVPLLLAVAHRAAYDRLRAPGLALLPYAARLGRLPAWAQQLIMESNGKSVRADGTPVAVPAVAPIVFGEPGTLGQHAFYQLLHQGTQPLACDLVLVAEPMADEVPGSERLHRRLLAHGLAQATALAEGLTEEEAGAVGGAALAPHRAMPGGHAVSVIVLPRLDAASLGALLALYEHATAVEGWLCGINSFDQYGVERGKVLARDFLALLEGDTGADVDPLARALAQRAHLIR